MSPSDIFILFFFVGVAVKTLFDSFKFWDYQDQLAILDAKEADLKSKIRMQKANKKAISVTRTPNRCVPNTRFNSRPVTSCHHDALCDKVPDKRIKKVA